MNFRWIRFLLLLSTPVFAAQQLQKKPVEQESSSTIAYKIENRSEAVEIKNVAYELTGSGIPGRPMGERLVLRKTTRTRQVLDEIGVDATTTIEAWPFGVDLNEKPLYALTVPGIEPVTMNSHVIVVSRGLEETAWWSVYKLGSAVHLFDTYVPALAFSISRDLQIFRYAGLQVPPDDVPDARLKAPNIVAVLTYASPDRVIREALVTCDDPKLARVLRSYADATRTISVANNTITVSISQNYPLSPQIRTIAVPLVKDDLDLNRSQTPVGLRVAAWKR